MKLRALSLLLFLACTLAACGAGQSGFNNLPAGAQGVHQRSAEVTSAQSVTTNQKIPIQITVFIPCANGGSGELVTLTGNLHALETVTINANNVHFSVLDNPQGITGVGSTTGAKYQGTGETRSSFNAANTGFPLTASYVNNFRMIGQGSGNNFMVHENAHITINANGQVTALQDNFSILCQ